MTDIAGLVMPLFGLIFLGYLVARIKQQTLEALGWLNTFIIYLALPALFFSILSQTPIEQLASWDFIAVNVGTTFFVFLLTFSIGFITSHGRIANATIQGLAGAYGNIGYMGPALAILALGERAAIPVALIFCFENIMHFTLAPAFMAVAGGNAQSVSRLALEVLRRIAFHPFILATAAGVAVAYLQVTLPISMSRLVEYLAQAAAPCALFAMGVTLALRRITRPPAELTYVVIAKLVMHPLLMYLALSYFGMFDAIWVFTAVLMAALPTATNVFVIAQQYGVWVEKASASILVSTMISVFTVSALLYAISMHHVPADFFP